MVFLVFFALAEVSTDKDTFACDFMLFHFGKQNNCLFLFVFSLVSLVSYLIAGDKDLFVRVARFF